MSWLVFLFYFPLSLLLTKFSFHFNNFADKRSTKPQLSLVNRKSLDRILQSEVYVNKANGQLRAAHLILGYTPISLAFQAPKYVIKANDPRLHHISVAYEGFVVPEGILIPEGTPLTQPLFVATPSVGASSSQLILEEVEEEEKEKQEEEKSPEGIVDLSDSSEEFEVFNQAPSPEGISTDVDFQHQAEAITSDEMGIQRKS